MRLRRRAYREVTPDELAAIGRPRMIERDLVCAWALDPERFERAESLAGPDADREALYAAVKQVWSE